MSATTQEGSSEQVQQSQPSGLITDEQNNNVSVSNNSLDHSSGDDNKQQGHRLSSNNNQRRHQRTGLGSTKKRPSVESGSSAASANGHSSGGGNASSQTDEDDDDEDDDGEGARTQMSSAEYEHIRNKTLLFFLDRLYLASQEGKEARTLHDLSCLFGTREFTKEMRQIVGASRNGLKKFLQSYPSLFQIEGDKVLLTQLKDSAQGGGQRDYNKEAVEYFKQKLLQFGSSLVPIKNLFGYRSQASQEVRHVSGKNSRDFKRFLKQNEDVFEILADEHVVLKSALRELESQGLSSLSLQQSLQPVPAEEATTMDPYLNKQLAHLIEDLIKNMIAEQKPPVLEAHQFKVSLGQLHERIEQQCQNELFLKMVKTVDDLRVFLRMHPKLFKRFPANNDTSNKQDNGEEESLVDSSLSPANCCFVGLLSESERRDLESQAYQASNLIQRQHSTLDQLQQQQQTTKLTPCSTTSTTTNDTEANRRDQAQQQQPASLPAESTNKTTTNTNEPPAASGEPAASRERAKSMRGDKGANPKMTSSGGGSSATQTSAAAPTKTNNKRPESNTSQDRAAKQHRQPLQVSRSNDRAPSQVPNNQSASQKLRANAPPFVPSRPQTVANQQQGTSNQQQHHATIHRQSSLITQAYRPSAQGLVANSTSNRQRAIPPAPIQRTVSNLSSSTGTHPGDQYRADQATPYQKRQSDMPPFDRRTAIRSYLMKGSGPGGSSNQHNMNWGHQQEILRGGGAPMNVGPKSLEPLPSRQRQTLMDHQPPVNASMAASNQEDLRARTVDIVREASNIITKIMTTTDAVAFDCKGYNLGFDGKITLIQFGFLPTKQVDPMKLANSMNKRFASSAPTSTLLMASEMNKEKQDGDDGSQDKDLKPEVCVFDLITNPELAYCLKPLLESDKIVKIVHDVRNKSNALHVQFNIILNNVFDTQVANLVIQQQVTGKPAYKSRYISMGKLCEIYGSEELVRYRDMIKMKTSGRGGGGSMSSRGGGGPSSSSKDVNYWRTRPLTRAMVLEATMDVYCLVGGIYQNLKSRIKPEYVPLFDLLNLEGVLARIKPEEIRSAKKERKIDMEVIDLKRKLYSDTTGPVVLSNREIRLLRHIDLTEGVRQKIQQCKKVAKKLERLDMKAALLKQQQLEGQEGGDEAKMRSLNSQLSSLNSHSNNSSLDVVNSGRDGGVGAYDKENEQRQEQLRARLEEFNAAVMMMDDSSMFDELKNRLNESTSLLESLENDDEDADEEAQLSSGHHSHNGSSINDCCRCQCHSHQQSSLDSSGPGLGGQPETAAKQQQQEHPESAIKKAADGSGPKVVAVVGDLSASLESQSGPIVQDHGEILKENQPKEAAPTDNSSKPSDLKPSDNKPVSQAERDKAQKESGEDSDDSKSSACDMAVQCDLLS